MKKITSLTLSCLVALGFFSCKNSVELVKRHYTGGYYISHTGKKINKDENKDVPSGQHIDPIAINAVKGLTDVKPEPILTAEMKNVPGFAAKETRKERSGSISKYRSFSNKEIREEKITRQPDVIKQTKPSEKQHVGQRSSDREILLIVLCIFIPPLAVYLKEDKIATNFWIDLILCFLFWIPGVIFAFLVCFDVI
jgi:uncharacterized membrane protein YqaE (UPF0057 family)